MSQKPETKFINKVHAKLPLQVYKQAMTLVNSNGTPDRYYEGYKGPLWIEYKYYHQLPRTLNLLESRKLTRLQHEWLVRAACNGVDVAVVVGFDKKLALILPGSDRELWSQDIDTRCIYTGHGDELKVTDTTGVASYIKCMTV